MLNQYLTRTQQLLQNPSSASTAIYATADLTNWINQARNQLAGDGECVRNLATISTVLNTRNYMFSSLSTGTPSVNGIEGVFHIRTIRYAVASGFQIMYSRTWEWFDFFYLNNPVPSSGPPNIWAQFKQGSAGTGTGSGNTGSFFLDPIPDQVYQLTCDSCAYPQNLAVDTDVEAIPWPWTDAVPYYAAYLALLSSQNNARRADAEAYFSYYQTFVGRARQFSNPALSRNQWEQANDPTNANKLGLKAGA